MKFLICALLIITYSFKANCQSRISDCNLLRKSLENSDINKGFRLDQFPNQTLTIIDTSNIFENCIFNDLHNRKIEVRHTLSMQKEKHDIMVFCLVNEKNKIVYAFFHTMSNVYMEIELKKKRRKIKTKVIKGGVF